MPVTAKLSRKFYETFGDDVANEIVEWFNQVDLTYRTELRDLNDMNFARLEAKLADLRSELIRWMFIVVATLPTQKRNIHLMSSLRRSASFASTRAKFISFRSRNSVRYVRST